MSKTLSNSLQLPLHYKKRLKRVLVAECYFGVMVVKSEEYRFNAIFYFRCYDPLDCDVTVYQSLFRSLYLSIYLSISPFVCFYLSIYLSFYISI